ncbi:hypothetical protein T439DRAFT_321022 [Meredithblackwellia eburnea MCA 4105]
MVPPRLGGSAPGVIFEIWLRSTTQTARNSANKFIKASREVIHHKQRQLASGSNRQAEQPLLTSIFESITNGVFKATRSAAHHSTGLHSTRLASRPNLLHHAVQVNRSIHYKAAGLPRKTFGPTPRPVLSTNVANVGLGAARNFSSSRPVLENIVNNVPLALRALGNTDGIDERKWRKIRHTVRKAESTYAKGQGRSPISRNSAMRKEFNLFFGSDLADNGSSSDSAIVEDITESVEPTFAADPVILVLPLDPSIAAEAIASTSTSSLATFSDSYRLLTPAVLSFISMIDQAYGDQAHRVRALMHRLQKAGVFEDDIKVQLDFSGGAKVAKFTFPLTWTRVDVLQACGHWRDGEAWFDVVGGELSPQRLAPVEYPSTPIKASFDFEDISSPETSSSFDEAENLELSLGSARASQFGSDSDSDDSFEMRLHAGVASTFVLPAIGHHSLLPPCDDISDTLSNWGEAWNPHEVGWGVQTNVSGDQQHQLWAEQSESDVEDEELEYAGQVRSFLESLEEVERERDFRPALVAGWRR